MNKDLEVPSVEEFRNSVDALGKNRNSLIIKTLYLTASRSNEFLTKTCPSDKGETRALGRMVTYDTQELNVPNIQYAGREAYVAKLNSERWLGTSRPSEDSVWILLLKIPVLKQRKPKDPKREKAQKFKMVALPINPQDFEPWTMDLLNWMKEHNGTLSFDLTRQTVLRIVKGLLGYHTHFLRDIRVTHLVNNYRFTGEQVSLVTGWTLSKSYGFLGQNVSEKMSIYLHSTWKNYISKLLVPIDTIKS